MPFLTSQYLATGKKKMKSDVVADSSNNNGKAQSQMGEWQAKLIAIYAVLKAVPTVLAQCDCSTSAAPSYGSVLTSGIQDVSAVAALFGTESCTEHVASGLTGGFLYPAAAGMSMFGSLGSAKAALYSIVSDSVLENLGAEPYGEFRRTLSWTKETSIQSMLARQPGHMRMVALGEIGSDFYIWTLKLTAASSLALLGMLSFAWPIARNPQSPSFTLFDSVMLIHISLGILVGYIGSFAFIQQFEDAALLYTWLAIEAVLMLLRVSIWSLNPNWDDLQQLTYAMVPDPRFVALPKFSDNGAWCEHKGIIFCGTHNGARWQISHAGYETNGLSRASIGMGIAAGKRCHYLVTGNDIAPYVSCIVGRNLVWTRKAISLKLGFYKVLKSDDLNHNDLRQASEILAEFEPIFDAVESKSIKQCKVINTINLGKILSASFDMSPDKIGSFGKQKVLDNPQIGCGCFFCMNGASVYATNVPLTLPKVHALLTWALRVSANKSLESYFNTRLKWAAFSSACTDEPILYKMWSNIFSEGNRWSEKRKRQMRMVYWTIITVRHWRELGDAWASAWDLDRFTDWACSGEMKNRRFHAGAFDKIHIDSWKRFVSCNPSAPDYTGTDPVTKLSEWKEGIPAKLRSELSKPDRAFNVRQQAFTWFHELSGWHPKTINV
ncbi:hypothetical protein NQZ79_g3069 [Umbelopsis isabellina]|nr:hypothetical protein NQZ79_g3069 [Umbelopsis isabellina]